MAKPLPIDYLQEDEAVQHKTGRHPLSVVDELLLATLVAGVAVAAAWYLAGRFFAASTPLAWMATAVITIPWLFFVLIRIWRVQTSIYIITDQRAYASHGRIRFFLAQTTFDKLTDLHVRQSLFGRIWGFGTIRLETAGTGVALHGVPDPVETKQRIEDARAGFLRGLIGENVPRVQRIRESATTLLETSPTGVAFITGYISSLLLMTVGLGFLLVPALAPEARFALLIGIVALSAGIATGTRIIILLRYTRYHLTTRGVVITSGWLTRRRSETTFEKVTDVMVFQGILGRMFDHGTITINTAGSNAAPVVFQGVRSPEVLKQRIDAAREEYA